MSEMTGHIPNERLNEYLDGVLSPSLISEIESHLAICEVCATRAKSLRTLFSTLEELPEWPLERDFSKAVLQAVRPEIVLPRLWKWAVGGQFILATLLIIVSLPTLIQTEWFATLPRKSNSFFESILELGLYFGQWTQAINQTLARWMGEIQALQIPPLPFSLTVLIPILLATGFLWLVGNGLLLKKRT